MRLSSPRMYRFMTVTEKLWSSDMGYPSTADISTVGTRSVAETFNGKLNGDYAWPFSLELPRSVALAHGPHDTYKLPGSARLYRAVVRYNISVLVVRGMFSTEHMWVINVRDIGESLTVRS